LDRIATFNTSDPGNWYLFGDPVFDRETKHIKPAAPTEEHSIYWPLFAAIMLVLAVISLLTFSLSLPNYAGGFAITFLVVNLITAILVAFAYARPASEFARLVVTDYWDQLRLTSLGEIKVLRAYYVATCIKSTNILKFERTLRLAVLSLCAIGALYLGLLYVLFSPLLGLAILVVVVALSIAFMEEPLYRLQGFTALGMALAVRFRHEPLLPFAIVGTFLGIQLLQLFALFFAGWLMLSTLEDASDFSGFMMCGVWLVMLVLLTPALRSFYQRLQAWSLNWALRLIRCND
jgi:hypothetical protein